MNEGSILKNELTFHDQNLINYIFVFVIKMGFRKIRVDSDSKLA